jgi:intracellular septation protein
MKKLLFDFFPLLVFFIAYKLQDIYIATGALMVASLIQIGYEYFRYGRVEAMHLATFVLVLVFGGLTIYMHNDKFIQWKVTILNWLFACLFLFAHFFMDKPLIRLLMEHNLSLPDHVWKNLSRMWIVFFILSGALNLYVAYHFSLDTWVDFKTFGLIGLTLLFVIIQSFYLYRYLPGEND